MTTASPARIRGLASLARSYGVQTTYQDANHQRVRVSPEAVLATLRTLGAPVDRFDDIADALRARHRQSWQRCAEPVVVVWQGVPRELDLRLDAVDGDQDARLHLQTEHGASREWSCDLGRIPCRRTAEVDGRQHVLKRLPLPDDLPPGYHRLRIELHARAIDTMLVSAPARVYREDDNTGRSWLAFLPLYALRSARNWGAGDYSDLEALGDWASELGAAGVGTLPLLPAFLDHPCDPSPYAPVSRRVWNEYYVDVTKSPELAACPEARAYVESSDVRQKIAAHHANAHVDYRGIMAMKRRALELLAAGYFQKHAENDESFRAFLRAHPHVEDYARFRAVVEQRRSLWPEWPSPLRDGTLGESDGDPKAVRTYTYAQWLAHRQIDALAQRSDSAKLYLDFPLGVHGGGYDVWRERHVFAEGAAAGAPPDPFFTGGQNWGFAPFHPARLRDDGYRHYIDCLRHHLRCASYLRIDHVMGLHRLYWIPQGFEPRAGTYVHYPAEEFYAILAVESHRHRTVIVGEDLGTVPRGVRAEMGRRGLHRMYVLPFELRPDPKRALGRVASNMVASLNTHDLPPFAAFWSGADIEDRRLLGLLDDHGVAAEREQREAVKDALASFLSARGLLKEPVGPESVLRACLRHLGDSGAATVVVNLEDLWLEPLPQNVPGTLDERPNWLRRARHSLQEIRRMPDITLLLRELSSRRSTRAPRRRKEAQRS